MTNEAPREVMVSFHRGEPSLAYDIGANINEPHRKYILASAAEQELSALRADVEAMRRVIQEMAAILCWSPQHRDSFARLMPLATAWLEQDAAMRGKGEA